MEDSSLLPALLRTSPASNAVEYGALNQSESLAEKGFQSGAATNEQLLQQDNNNNNPNSHYLSTVCIFEQDAWNDTNGTATIGNEILNLVKNIIGSGGFSLPAGIAAFANAPSAILPTFVIILLLGVINAYSFSLLGRICSLTQSTTYQQAWDQSFAASRTSSHGSHVPTLVGIVVTAKAIVGCWAFGIIIASTCQPLLSIRLELSKAETLIAITVLVLLPLCLAKNLGSLAGFSLIGLLGTVVTACTMALRYFDGSYQVGGKFYDDVKADLHPSFGDKGWASVFTPQSLILVSILSQGYVRFRGAVILTLFRCLSQFVVNFPDT